MADAVVRVMLVIPNEAERLAIRKIIEGCPRYQVVAEASVGETAIEMATETEPEIAVLEYRLMNLTGLGLSHFLTQYHPNIRILLYADCIREEWIANALGEGVRGFLLKESVERHLLPALDALSDHRPYWDGAVDEGLVTQLVGGPPRPPNGLTQPERHFIRLVAQGLSNKQIATVLDIPVKAAESFRTALRRKLRLRSTADIVRYALKHDIIQA